MKLNVKSLTLLLSMGVVLSLSGCGGGSSTSTGTTEEPPATEITYTGTDGSERTAPLSQGDAEVLAGEGYQHTLFDTAEKKCQHCHNELFDSWKTSMHSKSWSDKIFQSKHQDFLRVQLAKIGATNDIEYTTKTFENVSETCAKCHAPAAIYSDDFEVTLTEHNNVSELTTAEWTSLKASLESNIVTNNPNYTPHEPTTVASIGTDGVLRTATYHIGHENNREGINCATCHSIETVRMMTDDGRAGSDNGQYTLAKDVRGNIIGSPVRKAGETLYYDANASQEDMNIFFKLVGPEKYHNVANSPHNSDEFDINKSADGRFTFRGIDKDGTDGKTHYTGGPFYGPFGITGLDNSNEDDDTNRSAQVNPNFHKYDNNHFGDNGKALCLSCHQRSAGAIVPGTNPAEFMELCTTWSAVSNDAVNNNYDNTNFSPKCQECHMARVDEEFVLHQWAKPTTLFTQEFMAANNKLPLTPHFDPDNNDTTIDNPVRDKWMNDHAFAGGNKLGTPNFKAKFQSGFDSNLTAVDKGNGIQVKTVLENKTAHMLPGAHPMRRVLTRVIVTDENGVEQNVSIAQATSKYDHIVNKVVTGDASNTISTFGKEEVNVDYDPNRVITYQGKADELDNTQVYSQDFNGTKPVIIAPDDTVKNQFVEGSKVKGNVFNAAIVNAEEYNSRFTRIYGRETGKYYDLATGAPTSPSTPGAAYIVRPGFDSNIVPDQRDNRLQPNEREEYTINYNGLPAGDYTVKFKIYYLLKGANGQFPVGEDGFLKPLSEMTDIEKSHIVTEVANHEETVTVTEQVL
ncbi:MAG TPA: multiheme c-type cytochrome [Sulfurovum sp.]|uniref:multiheme c-type cytochrome n=1 Tax=Sulfurovum sp. TaxID=1969726 RepID=UPI002F91C465